MMTGIILVVVFLLVVIGIAVVFAKYNSISNRMENLENQLGIAVQPFWRHTLKITAPILLHPHKKYVETDDLIIKALSEPETPMTQVDKDRLDVLLDERENDTSKDMRPGEQDAAGIFKRAMKMARLENDSPSALTKPTVVGSQEVENQTDTEENKVEEAT